MYRVKYGKEILLMFSKWHERNYVSGVFWTVLLKEQTGIRFERGYLGEQYVVFPSEDEFIMFAMKYA